MKIADRTIGELVEYLDELETSLKEGYDERNEIELVTAELSRKRGLDQFS